MFEKIADHVDEITVNIQAYIKSTIEYHKLDLFKKSMKTVVSITRAIIVSVIFLIVLIFLSFGAAIWIGEELNNTSHGYFIVAGVYLFFMLLILIFGRRILTRIILRSASKTYFNK